jgi:hypothetical protein
MRRRTLLWLLCLAVVAATATVTACGGGGGGGGSPTQPTPTPTPPPPGITFTAQSGGGQNNIALASTAASDLNTLVLEVRANSVQDLYALAFDLRYPNAVLRYDGATAGFLNEGAQTSLNLVEPSPGTLVVGYTRLGAVAGASGSGVLLTLRFSAVAAGSGNFSFAQNLAFNARGDSIATVTWSAGSVQVVR